MYRVYHIWERLSDPHIQFKGEVRLSVLDTWLNKSKENWILTQADLPLTAAEAILFRDALVHLRRDLDGLV